MINKILVIIGLLSGTSAFCATPDSSLFASDFERKLFGLLSESAPIDTVDLFVALAYNSQENKEKVQAFAIELKNRVAAYPMAKKLKIVYKSVHDEFLTKYTEDATFNDIFINGNYNCVTASALYGLILQQLNIPYIIKETPVHVYIIADPNNSGFVIETTLPGEKIVQFDERFKVHYIEYLHNNKIISDSEFNNSTVDDLFANYYSKHVTISLKQLAGIHYYNKGIFLYNKSNYTESLRNFEKADILYKADMIRFMKNNALINVLNKEIEQKKYNGTTLAKYLLLNDSNSLELMHGKEIFEAVSMELVVNHPDISAYKKYFKEVTFSFLPDDASELFMSYNYYLGYHACVSYKYSEGLSYLSNSYRINPDNINTRQLISEAVLKSFLVDRHHNANIDSIEYYMEKYPFLEQNNILVQFLEYCYAKSIESYFQSGDRVNGNDRLKEYESFLNRHSDYQPNQEYIRLIYRQIGFYHLSRNQYDQAEQVLRKGIRLVPDAQDLKGILQSVMTAKGASYEYPELMDDSRPLKTYLMASAKAKDNINIINENIGKYLVSEWRLLKVIMGGVEKDALPDMMFNIKFFDDHLVEYYEDGEKSSGKWSYNNSRGIIAMTHEDEKEVLYIIITGIQQNRLQGVMYVDDVYSEAFECIFTSEK